MDPLVERYLRHLEVLGYSQETLLSHRWRLRPFLAYLRSQGITGPEGVTSAVLRNYQTFLFGQVNAQGRQNMASYRNNLLNAAKSLLKYLYQEEVIPEDPGEGVEEALEPRKMPRNILSEKEMERLLAMPDVHTVLGYRDRVILEVLYSTGIRRAELLNLRLADVDLEGGVLRINAGKWNKDRMVPLGKIAGRFLRHYLSKVRPHLVKAHTEDFVFLSEQGNEISKSMIGIRIKAYAKRAGIEKDICVHTLRATCATHCLRGKKRKHQMHPRHLMELLGHSSMESLNPYLQVSIVDLKEAHSRCHPREKESKVM